MSAPPGHRLRGWVAGVLVVVAGVLFPVSAVAYWANSSVLDEARFTAAVGPLAADPQVRASVSGALSSRVADVLRSGELVDQLPPALRPLGKQLADAVGQQLESAVTAVVSSDAFATAWTEANSKAQRSLVASLRGDDSGAVTAQGSQIVLDTGVFVQQLRDRLATGDLAVLAQVPLPERLSQQIVLVDTPQLENLVDAYPRVEPVAPWLIFAVLGLFAVAVVVAVRRLLVVGWIGVALLIGAGAIALFGRRAEQSLSDNLSGASLSGLAGPYWDALAGGLRLFALVAAAAGVVLLSTGLTVALLRRRT